jgi:hypothetical protein
LGTFWLKIEQFWPFEEISILKLLSQSQPNFAEMILGWSPFKIVAVSTVLYPRWQPLLKIEISSKGQNCSILSQKVPKFELYKHNEIFILSNGGHLGYKTVLTDTILKGDHPRIISSQFDLDLSVSDIFLRPKDVTNSDAGYTMAQKIVGKAWHF